MLAATQESQPTRRRVRFNRRALLLLVVLLVVPCSWLAVQVGGAIREEIAAAAITKSGGEVEWDRNATGSAWFHAVLGIHLFGHVIDVKLKGETATDSMLAQLDAMNHLQNICLESTRITDEGLIHCRRVHEIKSLQLYRMNATEALLEKIGGLDQLEYLSLVGTDVTDDGLGKLTRLSNLKDIFLYERNITDAGLAHIERMKELHDAKIGGTQATPEGVKKLQLALPACHIQYFP
jgi:hypothetical protein